MARAKGFTLLEVLISAVLIIIGVGSIGFTVVSVRRFFKDSEDRTRAMRLASSKIDEFLAKGYSECDKNIPSPEVTADGFSWSISVNSKTASGSKAKIPYKEAEVVVSYTADKGKGGINSVRNIRLTNILAYSMGHSESIALAADADAKVPWVATKKSKDYKDECLSGGCDCYDTCASAETDCSICAPFVIDENITPPPVLWGRSAPVGSESSGLFLRLEDIKWNTDKKLIVVYSISLHIEDDNNPSEIQPTDTVYTACFFDDELYGSVSRTPLRSQPSFNNSFTIENVKRDDPHTIEVRWYYSNSYTDGNGDKHDSAYTAAKISLNEAVLTVLAEDIPRA